MWSRTWALFVRRVVAEEAAAEQEPLRQAQRQVVGAEPLLRRRSRTNCPEAAEGGYPEVDGSQHA